MKTPPVVKWVANELAALKGELATVERELENLRVRKARLQEKVDALSTVFLQVAPDVPLVHVPVVRAHVRFGGRGNLRTWMLETLKAAYPRPLDTTELLGAASESFGIKFSSAAEASRFRNNSLTRCLRVAHAAGELERLDVALVGGAPGVWRWKPPGGTLDELARAVAESEAS